MLDVVVVVVVVVGLADFALCWVVLTLRCAVLCCAVLFVFELVAGTDLCDCLGFLLPTRRACMLVVLFDIRTVDTPTTRCNYQEMLCSVCSQSVCVGVIVYLK